MPFDLCPAAVNARRFPEQMALSWSGRSIAWDAFNNYVHSTSRYLKEIAVRSGAHIIVVKEASPAYVIVLLALWRIGAVPCPVDPGSLPERVEDIHRIVSPELVISARGFRKTWGPKTRWADIEHVVAYGYNDSFLGSEASLDPKVDAQAPALLRLEMADGVIQAGLLTRQELEQDPQELRGLFHALKTAETYKI